MKRRDLTSLDVLRSTTTYNADGQTVASINALGNRSTSIYDAGGRGVASVDAKGNRSTLVYYSKGRAAASLNSLGKRWTSIYNTVGQTVGSKGPLGNCSTSVTIRQAASSRASIRSGTRALNLSVNPHLARHLSSLYSGNSFDGAE